jgi:DNA-binding XRE family transcriptional regulator
MNKFAEWMKNNDKKQSGVAKKLNVGSTTLHEVLKKGLIPSLKLAYKIEQYTNGAITVYDWIDHMQDTDEKPKKSTSKVRSNKTE